MLNRVTRGLALVIFFCFPVANTRAATILVPAHAPSIQACINIATSGVDECLVAPGTYHEAITFLNKPVTLRSSGGADVTFIDATGLGTKVVTCISGQGAGTIIDGFTITGGNAPNGGGMHIDSSSPTVRNCTFSGNTASYGGGMFNSNGSPTVTNCKFGGNTASYGGGMANTAGSSPTVTNCTFDNNMATIHGGGMFNDRSSSPTVTNCTFTSNTAPSAGGGMFNIESSPTVIDCFFGSNSTSNTGGGMYNATSSPTVTRCTFSDNSATGGDFALEPIPKTPILSIILLGMDARKGGCKDAIESMAVFG